MVTEEIQQQNKQQQNPNEKNNEQTDFGIRGNPDLQLLLPIPLQTSPMNFNNTEGYFQPTSFGQWETETFHNEIQEHEPFQQPQQMFQPTYHMLQQTQQFNYQQVLFYNFRIVLYSHFLNFLHLWIHSVNSL